MKTALLLSLLMTVCGLGSATAHFEQFPSAPIEKRVEAMASYIVKTPGYKALGDIYQRNVFIGAVALAVKRLCMEKRTNAQGSVVSLAFPVWVRENALTYSAVEADIIVRTQEGTEIPQLWALFGLIAADEQPCEAAKVLSKLPAEAIVR